MLPKQSRVNDSFAYFLRNEKQPQFQKIKKITIKNLLPGTKFFIIIKLHIKFITINFLPR